MSHKQNNIKQSKISSRRLVLDNRRQIMGLSKSEWFIQRTRVNLQTFIEGIAFNSIIALLIVVNVTFLFAEILIADGQTKDLIIEFNDLITYIFIFELSLRFVVAPNKRIYFSNYWVDIISVLPVLRVFRSFRVVRLLRLLRLTRVVIILLSKSGSISRHFDRYFGSMGILFIAAVLLVLCGSLAMMSVEYTTGVSFDQFINSIWNITFLFISGEMLEPIPTTQGGKFVAVLVSFAGLVIFALMVGTVSASMTAYFARRMDPKDLKISDLKNHLIICGWESMAGIILSELSLVTDVWNRGVVVVAETDVDIAKAANIKNTSRLFHLKDDFTSVDVLEKAGAKVAKTAIVLADPGDNLRIQDRDARTVLAALTLERINPKIFTCAELLNEKNASHLKLAGVEEVISRVNLTAGLFASSAVNQGITQIVSDIMTHHDGNYLRKLIVPEHLQEKSFFEVLEYFKKEHDAMVVGIDRCAEDGMYKSTVNPPYDHIVKKDDRLTLIVKRESSLCDLGM